MGSLHGDHHPQKSPQQPLSFIFKSTEAKHCTILQDKMPPFGKLYMREGNPRSIVQLAIAKANNLELETVEVPQPPAADYHKVNSLGKIPSFEGADGFILSETIAIAIYLTSQNEKTTLLGKTKQDYASILKWLSFANQEILPQLGGWYRPIKGLSPYNKKSVEDSSAAALKAMHVLEEHLLSTPTLSASASPWPISSLPFCSSEASRPSSTRSGALRTQTPSAGTRPSPPSQSSPQSPRLQPSLTKPSRTSHQQSQLHQRRRPQRQSRKRQRSQLPTKRRMSQRQLQSQSTHLRLSVAPTLSLTTGSASIPTRTPDQLLCPGSGRTQTSRSTLCGELTTSTTRS